MVERSLQGHTDPLKERTLGIEVFGRDPDYDTNLDPVVRTTAVEIRKRIAQYYHEPGHETEIRIDFPPGTYLPEFRMPPKPAVVAPPAPAEPEKEKQLRPRKSLFAAAGAALAVILAVIFVRIPAKPAPIDQFWSPILSSSDPVTFYIGGYPTEAVSGPVVTVMDLMKSERVAFADSTTMARLAGLMSGHSKPYRIRLQTSSKLEDLRDGPAVLIGAFNNSFTLRLTSSLRFSFMRDTKSGLEWIRDGKNPDSMEWSHSSERPYTELTKDYAIICRAVDPTTGRLVVTASGLAKYGTEAAGEFLTAPGSIAELARIAPPDWSRKNMEIVIETSVLGRAAGPARIVATNFW